MIRFLASILVSALAFGTIAVASAAAQGDSLEQQKDAWQNEYRSKLRKAAHLEYTIEVSRENYARAQRRNYPRGGARQQFLIEADKAEKELADLRDEIDGFLTDARRNAIPPHWRFAVEDENVTFSPAATASEDDAGDDREGRNPLYLKDDDA